MDVAGRDCRRPQHDLVWEDGARAWAEQRPAPTLLVAPATEVGLTSEHLAAIEEFCTEHAVA